MRHARDAERTLDVMDPYTGTRVGIAPLASVDDVRAAFDYAMAYRPKLTRYERSQILERAARCASAPRKRPT